MAEPAWILSRRARLALSGGQPDEAQKIYEQLKAAGNRRAHGLRGKVVEGYVKRAEAALRTEDNAEAAWRDLFRAEKLDAADRGVVSLRDTLTQLGLKEVRSLLEAGRPLAAIQAATRLRDRPVQSLELAPLMSACAGLGHGRGTCGARRIPECQVRNRPSTLQVAQRVVRP